MPSRNSRRYQWAFGDKGQKGPTPNLDLSGFRKKGGKDRLNLR